MSVKETEKISSFGSVEPAHEVSAGMNSSSSAAFFGGKSLDIRFGASNDEYNNFECPEAAKDIQNGDELEINLKTAEIKNLTRHKTYQGDTFPAFIQQFIDAGGLLNSIKKK